MRVALFLGEAGRNASSSGSEVYESELVRGLAEIDGTTEYHVICLYPDGPKRIGVAQPNVRYDTLWPGSRAASMLTALPLRLARLRPDVFHATYMPPPFALQSYLFTLVCSSMFEHPEHYPPLVRARLAWLARRGLEKARLVLCISRHIRDTVQERFRIPDERLAVVPLAANKAFRPIAEGECRSFLAERYGIADRYFLFCGRWEPRKNIVRILEAFAMFKRETRSDVKLVCSGWRARSAREADAVIERHRLYGEVIDLGKSPFDELPYLYAGAEAIVFPSLWEGFGLPIVEGMAAGTPVITSNNSSMPEIGGDACLYVDPLAAEEIAAAMHRIVSDGELHARLCARGLERAKQFTWRRTASDTLAAYRQMAAIAPC